MAKLKAQRELEMEQRRARMAAKKSGSNKRAYDDEAINKKASEVFRDAFKKGGGNFARSEKRKFLKDAQYKMDTGATAPAKPTPPKPKNEVMDTKPAANAGTPTVTPMVTPRNKPTPPRRNNPKPPTALEQYQERQRKRITEQRKKALNNIEGQNEQIRSFFKNIFPGNSDKPPSQSKIEEANRLVEEGYRTNESINRIANKVKNTLGSYVDTDQISSFIKDVFTKDPIKLGDTINRNPPNRGPYAPGFQTEVRPLGSNKMKKGGKVKKGRSVKKGYKSGGKVRGAGCVTKGVRPCKMR